MLGFKTFEKKWVNWKDPITPKMVELVEIGVATFMWEYPA